MIGDSGYRVVGTSDERECKRGEAMALSACLKESGYNDTFFCFDIAVFAILCRIRRTPGTQGPIASRPLKIWGSSLESDMLLPCQRSSRPMTATVSVYPNTGRL